MMDVVTLGMAKAEMDRRAPATISRFLAKCASGQAVKIGALGDSGLEGTTVASGLNADGGATRVGVLGVDDLVSLLATGLASRYGITVTKYNRAVSGHTTAATLSTKKSALVNPNDAGSGSVNSYPFTKILLDQPDLILLSYGHNDLKGFSSGAVQGLSQDTSLRLLEHMFRRLRKEVPGADLMFISEWPYLGGFNVGSDALLVTYNKAARVLCASYGVEYVDGYAAFKALGVTGMRAVVDATNHPNADGHAVWVGPVLKRFPSNVAGGLPQAPNTPSTTLYNAHRVGPRSMLEMTVPTQSAGYGTDRFRLFPSTGSGWDTQAATPATTSQAGDVITVQYVGSDALLRLDCGAGNGVVNIDVDGIRVYSNFDLSTKAAGQNQIPLSSVIGGTDSPRSGIHIVTVTLVSGSMTYRGFAYVPGGVEWFSIDSTKITYSAGWGASGSNSLSWNNRAKTTSTTTDSVSFDFVGTKAGMLALRYNVTPRNVTVSVDGGASTTVDFGGNLQTAGTNLSAAGSVDLVSGLPYGRHTITITATGTVGTWQVYAFYSADETRLRRSTRQTGVAIVGDVVTYAEPFTGRPTLRITPNGAGDAYATSDTKTGFTLTGTAGMLASWEAEGDPVTI
jgi:lysophospholipase L1-like esterase